MSLDINLNVSVYSANITHNLGKMADEVKINDSTLYYYLWRPNEIGIYTARDLIEPLSEAIKELEKNKHKYQKFNPENGWGNYEGLLIFTKEYLRSCALFQEANIDISR